MFRNIPTKSRATPHPASMVPRMSHLPPSPSLQPSTSISEDKSPSKHFPSRLHTLLVAWAVSKFSFLFFYCEPRPWCGNPDGFFVMSCHAKSKAESSHSDAILRIQWMECKDLVTSVIRRYEAILASRFEHAKFCRSCWWGTSRQGRMSLAASRTSIENMVVPVGWRLKYHSMPTIIFKPFYSPIKQKILLLQSKWTIDDMPLSLSVLTI